MSIFDFLKKNKFSNGKSICLDIKHDNTLKIALSKSILDAVFVYDIIYAEVAEEGAGGCPGEAMFYVIQDEELVCYVTRIFENKDLYIKIEDLLYSKCDINNEHVGEVLFNYYYGGLGNKVL